MTSLERSYRRLLLAYPGPYRRRHGIEILTTLLEMAEPGQRRPYRADAWHLVASGIRQRFRLPARRPVAIAGAVLATLVLGAFGAALGSWSGWQAAADLPDDATMTATARAVAEKTSDGTVMVSPAPNGSPIRARLQSGGTVPLSMLRIVRVPPRSAAHPTPEEVEAVLAAHGWRRTGEVTRSGEAVSVRDGVRLATYADTGRPGYRTFPEVRLDFSSAQPALVRPLVIAGAVLGGVLGWLLAAGVAQRSRGRRGPALVSAAALVTLVLPASAIHNNALRLFRLPPDVRDRVEYAVHTAFAPAYYPFGPEWQVLGLSVAGGALALTAVVLARVRPATTADAPPIVQAGS